MWLAALPSTSTMPTWRWSRPSSSSSSRCSATGRGGAVVEVGERQALVGHVGVGLGRDGADPGDGGRDGGTHGQELGGDGDPPGLTVGGAGHDRERHGATVATTPGRSFSLGRTKAGAEHARPGRSRDTMTVRRVALLTAGGLAPCLSSAVGALIERYTELEPEIEIIAYLNGYAGLLGGEHITVTPADRERAHLLHGFGGSPIGNSRVKLTNVKDCVKRGLVSGGPGSPPRRRRAAHQGRRRRAAHHRRRRHEHDRRRPGGLPARERLRADRRRPAQDDRQRRRPDPAVAWGPGRPPSRARCSPATSSPSTPPTRGC